MRNPRGSSRRRRRKGGEMFLKQTSTAALSGEIRTRKVSELADRIANLIKKRKPDNRVQINEEITRLRARIDELRGK